MANECHNRNGGEICAARAGGSLVFMTIGTALANISLMLGRRRTVGAGNIGFLFGLGLNFVFLLWPVAAASEVNAIDEEIIVNAHCSLIEIRI